MAFRDLLEEVRTCRICEDVLPLGPGPVLQASPRARILIAGQAPGRLAHQAGVPFQDPSGERLREWMGIDEDTFYDPAKVAVLPMAFCYPGKGASGDLAPRPECAQAWRAQLLKELRSVELTLVIGAYAHAYHLQEPRKTLTNNVKAWRDYWPVLVPLPHPSPRNQRWLRSNPWFAEELLPKLRHRIRQVLR